MSKFLRISVLACCLAWPVQAPAAGTGGCDSFEWRVKTELEWMASADAEAVTSGATLAAPPGKAIAIALQPMAAVTFAVPSSGKPKGDPAKSFAGVVTFDGVETPGLYQVSLSSAGWIDVVQNGKALDAQAHTGKSDCEGLRKSVRFKIESGPFAVQLSGVPNATIKVVLRPAE